MTGRRNKPGFTLIETTVVFLIVIILAGMVTGGPGKRWQVAWQERWFFKRFNATWVETVTNPRLLQTDRTIVFTKKQVRFIVERRERRSGITSPTPVSGGEGCTEWKRNASNGVLSKPTEWM